jgi:hypothetical protein
MAEHTGSEIIKLNDDILLQAWLNFYVVRETSANFSLHADNMKFDKQNEE